MKNYKEFINENIFDFLKKKKKSPNDNRYSGYWIVPTKYPYFKKALEIIGMEPTDVEHFELLFNPELKNNKDRTKICIIKNNKSIDIDQFFKDREAKNNLSKYADWLWSEIDSDLGNTKFMGEIKLEDLENNRIVILTESEILSFDRISKEFVKLEENVTIPENYGRLMFAINNSSYSPENNSFGLNENWDFDLQLKENGLVMINDKLIPNDKVKDLLLESVRVYSADPLKVRNFNKIEYLKDADNFISLMENHKHLIKLDNLEVIKNLNESSYVMFDKKGVFENNKPTILSSSLGISNKTFDSYSEMLESVNAIVYAGKLNSPIVPLFESQLQNEATLINERNQKMISLNEEQSELNTKILQVRNLKSTAEENSPAMVTLNEQENILDEKLKENIISLNEVTNNFKLVK